MGEAARSHSELPLPDRVDLETDAGTVVAEVLEDGIEHVQTISRGVMTFKCSVQTQRFGRYVVRFYPPRRSSVVECEPDLLNRCRHAGIPVPVVVTDSRVGPSASLEYVVYHEIEGRMLSERLPVMNSERRRRIAFELSELLARLGQVSIEGYGDLIDGRTARESSWSSFIAGSVKVGLESMSAHSILDVATIRRLRGLLERVCLSEFPTASRLVWGDISFDNILVDGFDRVVGLVDFESCLGGDPLATLGCCFAMHGEDPFSSALIDAWPGSLDDAERKRILVYALVRVLRLARWAHLPLPTGLACDPIDQVCRGLIPAMAALCAKSED